MESKQSHQSDNNKLICKIDRVLTKIEVGLMAIAGVSLIAMLLSISYGVFSREFLTKSALWTNDFAGYLMVYLVFLAAPWLLTQGAHVTVDLFVEKLSGLPRKLNFVFVYLVSAISSFLLFWFGLDETIKNYQKGTVMIENVQWPQYILLAPIALGSLFLFIRFILEIVLILSGVEKEKPEIES